MIVRISCHIKKYGGKILRFLFFLYNSEGKSYLLDQFNKLQTYRNISFIIFLIKELIPSCSCVVFFFDVSSSMPLRLSFIICTCVIVPFLVQLSDIQGDSLCTCVVSLIHNSFSLMVFLLCFMKTLQLNPTYYSLLCGPIHFSMELLSYVILML